MFLASFRKSLQRKHPLLLIKTPPHTSPGAPLCHFPPKLLKMIYSNIIDAASFVRSLLEVNTRRYSNNRETIGCEWGQTIIFVAFYCLQNDLEQ